MMSEFWKAAFQSVTTLPADCPCAEGVSPTTAASKSAVTTILVVDLRCMGLLPPGRESLDDTEWLESASP